MTAMRTLGFVVVLTLGGCYQPQPQYGGGNGYSSSPEPVGGCKKGCRCGNSCIDCSKVCHGGGTHRKRKH